MLTRPRGAYRLLATTAGTLLLGAAACSPAPSPAAGSTTTGTASKSPIKIAAMADSTGGLAFFGTRANQGWDLARDKAGTEIGGHPIEYQKVQCATPADCTADTERLVKDQGVNLILGTPGSALALAISQTAARLGVVHFESGALANDLLPAGDAKFIFRGGVNDDLLGAGVEEALKAWSDKSQRSLQGLSVVQVNESSASNHNQSVVQQSILANLGTRNVGKLEYDTKSTDYSSLAAKIVSLQPDVLVETSYVQDMISLNTELAQRGFSPKLHVISGTPAPADQLTALGPKYLDGIMASAFPDMDTNEKGATGMAEFKQAYKAKFGSDPDSAYALTYYVGALIMYDILKQSQGAVDPESFRKAILAIDKPVGSYANGWGAKFDAHGQNTRTRANILQWQDGKVCTVAPQPVSACDLRVPSA